jgi:hypothetical protein
MLADLNNLLRRLRDLEDEFSKDPAMLDQRNVWSGKVVYGTSPPVTVPGVFWVVPSTIQSALSENAPVVFSDSEYPDGRQAVLFLGPGVPDDEDGAIVAAIGDRWVARSYGARVGDPCPAGYSRKLRFLDNCTEAPISGATVEAFLYDGTLKSTKTTDGAGEVTFTEADDLPISLAFGFGFYLKVTSGSDVVDTRIVNNPFTGLAEVGPPLLLLCEGSDDTTTYYFCEQYGLDVTLNSFGVGGSVTDAAVGVAGLCIGTFSTTEISPGVYRTTTGPSLYLGQKSTVCGCSKQTKVTFNRSYYLEQCKDGPVISCGDGIVPMTMTVYPIDLHRPAISCPAGVQVPTWPTPPAGLDPEAVRYIAGGGCSTQGCDAHGYDFRGVVPKSFRFRATFLNAQGYGFQSGLQRIQNFNFGSPLGFVNFQNPMGNKSGNWITVNYDKNRKCYGNLQVATWDSGCIGGDNNQYVCRPFIGFNQGGFPIYGPNQTRTYSGARLRIYRTNEAFNPWYFEYTAYTDGGCAEGGGSYTCGTPSTWSFILQIPLKVLDPVTGRSLALMCMPANFGPVASPVFPGMPGFTVEVEPLA